MEEGGVSLRAPSRADLVKLLADHRKSNGFVPGDVEADVDAAICGRWPSGCYGAPTSLMTGVSKFALAMHRWSAMGNATVTQQEADRRAEICAQCHNNKSEGGCVPCNKAKNMFLKGVQVAKIGDLHVSQEDKLKNCALCGCSNAFQVHAPLAVFAISEQEKNEYPSFCWKKG